MTFTYDPSTDRGKVRLLISDVSSDAALQVFQDSEIDAFLVMNRRYKRAAAAALLVIAASAVQTDKVLRSQDLQVDAAKAADAMRQLAKALRDEADRDDDDGDDGQFEIVDFDRYAAFRNRY